MFRSALELMLWIEDALIYRYCKLIVALMPLKSLFNNTAARDCSRSL